MSVYALWNNKGGVGKSYLTFQIASRYADIHRDRNVLVIDLCPQANVSTMLLGGIINGEENLNLIQQRNPLKTISGYIKERILSPYSSPNTGSNYIERVYTYNQNVPDNLYLVTGDERLELQSSRISNATNPGPDDAWRTVHLWINDLISDVKNEWNNDNTTVFIDCNPSFSIYTELALSSSDRIIIPFSADGSSKRAVKAVLSLIYGIQRQLGDPTSEFKTQSEKYRMSLPKIYMYVGNRLTQMNNSSASAFKTVVEDISTEIFSVWSSDPTKFCVHPSNSVAPTSKKLFKNMFQYEVNDANTASVVSGALGIPIYTLTAGQKILSTKRIHVNQTQLDKQVPNIITLVDDIE